MGQVSDFGLGHLSAQKKPCLFGLKERFTANLFLSAVCRLSRICSGRLIVAAASEGCRCIGPKQIARSLRALRNADRLSAPRRALSLFIGGLSLLGLLARQAEGVS